jgi:transposase
VECGTIRRDPPGVVHIPIREAAAKRSNSARYDTEDRLGNLRVNATVTGRWHDNRHTLITELAETGVYVIRTSVGKEALSRKQVLASYKSLSGVERAFRSLKTVDLQVRPIHHRLPDRVRAHILLCMLAYYVEWHMRQLLAPILFDDHDKPQAKSARAPIVAPAQRSAAALRKAGTKKTDDGLKAHSFQTLLGDLATIVKNRIQPKDKITPAFDILTTPQPFSTKPSIYSASPSHSTKPVPLVRFAPNPAK